MIVQIDALCFAAVAIPLEDKSTLFVDANGMVTRQVTLQFLEMVARRHAQVLNGTTVKPTQFACSTTRAANLSA